MHSIYNMHNHRQLWTLWLADPTPSGWGFDVWHYWDDISLTHNIKITTECKQGMNELANMSDIVKWISLYFPFCPGWDYTQRWSEKKVLFNVKAIRENDFHIVQAEITHKEGAKRKYSSM